MSKYFVPKEYLFEQATAADIWVIKHSCGKPVIDIFVQNGGVLERMLPTKIEYVSDSQCKVYFSQPFSGFAKISG